MSMDSGQGDNESFQESSTPTANLTLTSSELREVTVFALSAAIEVLPIFEADRPSDPRPRQAIEAAHKVVDGAPRSKLQRIAAPAAHRAAKQASSRAAFHAAMAAGDAGASMYLHPLANATQVNHILRATAHAACAFELVQPDLGDATDPLARAVQRATPTLITVLHRYPATSPGSSRVSQLVHQLDTTLRNKNRLLCLHEATQ
jgi:hypothetical protein